MEDFFHVSLLNKCPLPPQGTVLSTAGVQRTTTPFPISRSSQPSDIPWKNVESKETPFGGLEEDVICPGRKLPHRPDGGSGAWEWPAKLSSSWLHSAYWDQPLETGGVSATRSDSMGEKWTKSHKGKFWSLKRDWKTLGSVLPALALWDIPKETDRGSWTLLWSKFIYSCLFIFIFVCLFVCLGYFLTGKKEFSLKMLNWLCKNISFEVKQT